MRDRIKAELADTEIIFGDALVEPAQQFVRIIELLTFLILFVLVSTLCVIVIFATYARFEASAKAVRVLHLLGADDRAITLVIVYGALRTALIGGAIGSALAMVTLHIVARLAAVPGVGEITVFSLFPASWPAISLLPPAAALIAALTAGLAAQRTLAAMA